MPVPPKRLPARRGKTRASHHALKKMQLVPCPKCKKPKLPHFVCKNCGFYKGKDILKLEAKLSKKAKLKLAKDKKAQEKIAKKDKK
jgi:large subunit ribosomal protein L32